MPLLRSFDLFADAHPQRQLWVICPKYSEPANAGDIIRGTLFMSLLRSFDLFADAHPQLALWATNIATPLRGFSPSAKPMPISIHQSAKPTPISVAHSASCGSPVQNIRARECGRHNSRSTLLCRPSGASIYSLMLTPQRQLWVNKLYVDGRSIAWKSMPNF